MKVFGLTGGIGMGKSTAGLVLGQLGCRVVDTDEIARQLVEPGQPALDEIRQTFGEEFLDGDGRLRRDSLARRIFGSTTDRQRLEAILHPRIRAHWVAETDRWRGEAVSQAVVIIPLLFETGAEADVDATICVACPEPLQRGRLADRGWTAREVRQRLDAQWPVRRKIEFADHLVWNCAGLDVLEAQLARILAAAPGPGTGGPI